MGSKRFKYNLFHIHQSLQRDKYTIIFVVKYVCCMQKTSRRSSDTPEQSDQLHCYCYLNNMIALQAASAYPKLWQISVNETSEQSGQRSFILLSQHYDCYTCLVLLFNILARSNTSL